MTHRQIRVRIALGPTDPLVPEVQVLEDGEARPLPLAGVAAIHLVHEIGYLPRAWVEVLNPDAECLAELTTRDRERARRALRNLGKEHHPCAGEDPVGALAQVAADLAQVVRFAERPAPAGGGNG